MKKTYKNPVLWIGLLWLLVVFSCGINDLGILSIEFDLNPTAIDSLPTGLDPDDFVTLNLAHGTVRVDVIEGSGTVTAEGLPVLPEPFEYQVMLQMTHSERDALEPDDPHGEGHGGAEHGDEEGGFETIPIGSMMTMGESWMIDFDMTHMSNHSMGSIRAAMVMIAPPEGELVTVLFGQVRIEDDGSGEGGHEHGG